MAGIDDVLERLITDDAFRALLATDPDSALTGYDLTDDDRALLVSQVSSDAGRAGTLEGRTSKAGLFGLLGGLDEIADAVAGDDPVDRGAGIVDVEKSRTPAPTASGATMSTDTWDEPTASGEAPGETITIHGPYDLPSAAEPDDAPAPAQKAGAGAASHGGEIDVQSVDWGAGQPAAGDEHEIEMTVEAGESDEPPRPDEVAATTGVPAAFDPDRATTMTGIALAESGGSHADPGGEDSRGLWQINVDPAGAPDAAADEGAHVAISLGDGRTIEAQAAPGPSPTSGDTDPDQFDTSELVQWAAGRVGTEPNPAELGATPDTGSGGAGSAEGATEPPTPDR